MNNALSIRKGFLKPKGNSLQRVVPVVDSRREYQFPRAKESLNDVTEVSHGPGRYSHVQNIWEPRVNPWVEQYAKGVKLLI
jgi:hypothetical protein